MRVLVGLRLSVPMLRILAYPPRHPVPPVTVYSWPFLDLPGSADPGRTLGFGSALVRRFDDYLGPPHCLTRTFDAPSMADD